ncbi:MAG TPA: hypothetical protein VLF91_05390 [Candidatus Saccharimonadales bacterium]|nr:hypothetical protein [Candidatus Saccharimonadales bacterium]
MPQEFSAPPVDYDRDTHTWHDAALATRHHPALSERTLRLLAARGLPVPDFFAQPAERAVEAEVGAPEPLPAPEADTPSAEEISQTFDAARKTAMKLSSDPRFIQYCKEHGLDDPYDAIGSRRYCTLFADFSHSRITQLRAEHANRLRLDALELVTAVPSFLFAQYDKDHGRPAQRGEQHGTETSHFSGLLRSFGTRYTDARLSTLNHALLSAANQIIESPRVLGETPRLIDAKLRGAQHEVGFYQLLQAAKLLSRPATDEEDGRGADYFVLIGKQRLLINVKASLHEIDGPNPDSPFSVKPDGLIFMYSLLRPAEFGDSFRVPETVVQERAPRLKALLGRAAQGAHELA